MEQELAGKVAIVTGAGRMRSIGRPIAVHLAAAGAAVVVTGTGRSPDHYPDHEKQAGWNDIQSVAEEIRAAGGTCIPIVSDVSDENACNDLVQWTAETLGRLDIVVNNAGAARSVGEGTPTIDLDTATWRKVQSTNLDGTFFLARAACRQMVKQGEGGSFIGISSIASKLPGAGFGAYAPSKAAINALCRVLALELAPHNIRVNAVCPGIIDTGRMDDLGRDELWNRIVKQYIPLGYAGDGNETAELCLFLVSDRGKWVTGQAINVDGGHVWGQ